MIRQLLLDNRITGPGSSGVEAFRSAAKRFRTEGCVVLSPSGVFASSIDGFAPFGVTMTDTGWGSGQIGTRTYPADATFCVRSDEKTDDSSLWARLWAVGLFRSPSATPLNRPLEKSRTPIK